jgi:tRNA nucleotidyltransferase (CCA-adding enzyme)
VGNPVDRFTEDGLRVMRAVRFAAQLEFELDAETEAGIAPALPSLSKVSRERVSDELRKLLKSREPSRGLRPAVRTGILANILPELDVAIAGLDAWVARIDRADPDVRLAALVLPLQPALAADVLKRLKFSNAEIEIVGQVLRIAGAPRTSAIQQVRHELSRIDKSKREHAVKLWASEQVDTLVDLARQILDGKHPLGAGDLAITGKDLMDALDIRPGPRIGRILERLVNFVIEDPARNTREMLLAEAQRSELEYPA